VFEGGALALAKVKLVQVQVMGLVEAVVALAKAVVEVALAQVMVQVTLVQAMVKVEVPLAFDTIEQQKRLLSKP
jgi:replication-associated recombination protein RarA